MDTVGGPDALKARWSPNSFDAPTTNGLVTPTSRDAFANYGYGSQAGIPQAFSNGSPPSSFSGLLYSTSINSSTGYTARALRLLATTRERSLLPLSPPLITLLVPPSTLAIYSQPHPLTNS
ncbi:hypothetical protein EDB83DRAFT_1604440 [Lactarius deliciosus]|nr:hypothetical protein EDB83DRAFT_1604440 [Lactarius deliciosus]